VADSARRADHPLKTALEKEGYRFSFFQAVRLLQQLRPEAPRIGFQGPPGKEIVRLRPALNLEFASSDVESIREVPGPAGSSSYEITTNFLSLYGAVSPLPIYYTEDLLGQDDESLQRDFMDLFHHRLLSLFYRCWEKYRFAIQFTGTQDDYYSRRLLLLLGVDPDTRTPDHPVPAYRYTGLAGLLTQIPHSAASLQAILGDYFGDIPVRVESCVGRHLPIPADQLNRLGVENCSLGQNLSLGERVFDRACTFRVALGPLELEDFLSFLPPGEATAQLRELVDHFNGDGLDYEVEISIRREAIPPLQLSGRTALLGWSTWLGQREGSESRVRFLVKGWFHGRG
jgi:type VI secretion system protein ImpH